MSGVAVGRRGGVPESGPAAGRARGRVAVAVQLCVRTHSRVDGARALDQNRIRTHSDNDQHNRLVYQIYILSPSLL